MTNQYFSNLNYTLGNEDPTVELSILPLNAGHVFTIAGSGSRVIPLFARQPNKVTCVDSSIQQLSFAETRIETVRALDRQTFLAFWGYPGQSMSLGERKHCFEKLELSTLTRSSIEQIFKANNWQSLLYLGKWERTFRKLSILNRFITGRRSLGLFDSKDLREQADFYRHQFPKVRWALSVFLLGKAALFNALLYRGEFPKKNIPQSAYRFYAERFRGLFQVFLARQNFFLQLLFFGELRFMDGLPLECEPTIYLRAKQGIDNAQIEYVCGNIVEEASIANPGIDFLSLSDIPSYFKPPLEQEFLQKVRFALSPSALVIARYYLRIPENVDVSGYSDLTDRYRKVIAGEKVQMYSFGIYQIN
jgi:S-adenosylmethionine-diacylglycerol 3-amino-3-carboxypropyl transferase